MSIFKEELRQEAIRPDMEFPAIPLDSVEAWKNIPVQECGEKLVPVGAFSDFSDCDTSAVYFGERGKGEAMNFLGEAVRRDTSLITHFVREGVLSKLQKAQSMLPKGYYFRFLDDFRPVEVQQALFDAQKEKFRLEFPDWDGAKLEAETQKYVSLPSPNLERGTTHPSPHSTGGVVDLTIIKMSDEGQKLLSDLEDRKRSGDLSFLISKDEVLENDIVVSWISEEARRKGWTDEYRQEVEKNWLAEYRYAREKAQIFKNFSASLNMGTDFDHFGPEAATRYLEDLSDERELTGEQKEALQNRRFLYDVMKKSGFSNYPEEWWHWSTGDNMDAANMGKEFAVYGGAQMSDDNIAFEKARRGPYLSAIDRIGEKGLFIDRIEEDPTELAA
jgi:D-alanyl-D-alanine dipeptidase